MQLRYFYLWIVGGMLFALQAKAQVSGIVRDSATNEKLSNATVIIQNQVSRYIKETSTSGEFVFDKIKEGSYTLTVDFEGYRSYSKPINITTSSLRLSVFLSPVSSALGNVNVYSSINHELESSSRKSEKNANNIVNIISAQIIQRSADVNAAYVLQRMPGITLQKNTGADEAYAIVRGLEPRYNNTLVNGIKISSPDEKSRFVSLDIVPSDLLQRIEISKSLLPEMEGDAIGGTVNLIMKDAPDTTTFIGTASFGYSNILLNRKYTYFSKSDIQQKSLTERLGSGYVAQPSDFSRSNLDFKQKVALPTGIAGVTWGKRFLNQKLGFLINENFQNQYYGANTVLNTVVPDVNLSIPAISDVSNRIFSTQQLNNGLSVHVDYNINAKNKITVNNVLLYSYVVQARTSIDTAIKGGNGGRTVPGTGPISTDYLSLTTHELLENLKVDGSHILSSHFLFDWAGVYSYAAKRAPDRADISVNKKIDTLHTTRDANGPYTFTITPNYFDDITRIWQHNEDRDMSGYANLNYKTVIRKTIVDIKVGGLYRHKERFNKQDEYDLKPTTNSNGVKQVFTDISSAQWVVYNAAGTYNYDVNNYHAFENIGAGYVEAKISAPRVDVFGGVRSETTQQGFTINTFYADQVNGVTKNYTDLLPSLMIKYKLNNKTNIRASYFKSIARPNYYELVPYRILSNTTAIDEQGNPNLRHSVADNFDVRYELYPKEEEQLFIGGFYKLIQDPIEFAYVDGTTYTPVNLGTATLYGAELVWGKTFGNIGFSANYTYIYSKIYSIKSYTDLAAQTTYDKLQKRTMQGQTNNTANLSLYYRNTQKKIFVQVAYQYLGKTLSQVYPIYGFDYYQQPQSFLAASAEYGLGKHLTFFGKFNNLLNTPTIYKINTLTVGKDIYKASFLLGFRYHL